MSIIMISGVPGSGKSIKAVEDFLLPALPEMIKFGREYIKSIEGQRAIVMSNGLKIMAGIDSFDDKDLLEREEEQVEEWDVHTPHEIWQHIKINEQLSFYEQLILLWKADGKPFYDEWALHTLLDMEIQGIVSPFDGLEPRERLSHIRNIEYRNSLSKEELQKFSEIEQN